MGRVKRVLVLGAFIFIMAAFSGCAGSGAAADDTPEAVYHPKLPAGIETFDAARRDLAGLLENRKSNLDFHFDNNYCVQHHLQDLILSEAGHREIGKGAVANAQLTFYGPPPTQPFGVGAETKTISVRADMLKETSRLFVLYADLPGLPITVRKFGNYQTVLLGDNQVYIEWLNREEAQRIADDLFFIQQNYQKHYQRQLALFEARAAQYRRLAVKPRMSEEQRKYVVQANALARSKDYDGAIELYLRVVDLDPVSYPNAYCNLALLSAQLYRFEPAICYMKQYLLLVPDAKDARNAQDKIYEWELKPPNP